MGAADRHAVGIDHAAVEEDRHGGGAAAHVDHGDAEIAFILDQAGKTGGIGRNHESLDAEMTALDHAGDVPHRAGGGGHQMHVGPEPVAAHAARIPDASAAVDGKADWDRMDELTVRLDLDLLPLAEDAAHV